MPTLTIKNVPDELYKQLKQRAVDQRRSINSEALTCLERSLRRSPRDVNKVLERVNRVREKTKGLWLTDELLSEAKSERRL